MGFVIPWTQVGDLQSPHSLLRILKDIISAGWFIFQVLKVVTHLCKLTMFFIIENYCQSDLARHQFKAGICKNLRTRTKLGHDCIIQKWSFLTYIYSQEGVPGVLLLLYNEVCKQHCASHRRSLLTAYQVPFLYTWPFEKSVRDNYMSSRVIINSLTHKFSNHNIYDLLIR